MDNSIISIFSASIQALGGILAALITVLLARRIVKEDINPHFQTYSDKSHDVRDVLQNAQNDIFIAAEIGDKLLNSYIDDIEKKLKNGIHVRYLLLDKYEYQKMERYLHNDRPKGANVYNEVMQKLLTLMKAYPELLEVRVFQSFITASYIGIDIWPKCILLNSGIQIMIYQYNVGAKSSPITYVCPKSDRDSYNTTVKSIKTMWKDAIELYGSEHAVRGARIIVSKTRKSKARKEIVLKIKQY